MLHDAHICVEHTLGRTFCPGMVFAARAGPEDGGSTEPPEPPAAGAAID